MNLKLATESLVAGFKITGSLVAGAEGQTVSEFGNSRGLGSETDLELLKSLRRQAQVVLTSGETFRAEEYRFPSHGNLAVLTNRDIDVEVPKGRELHCLSSGYTQAISELSEKYSRIHAEYGIGGMTELIKSSALDALFLSSRKLSGITELAARLQLTPAITELPGLFVGTVAWRDGKPLLPR